jgi:hypothetical protein
MKFIVRWFLFLFFKLHLYRAWSNLYRFIWERRREPLKNFASLKELVDYIRDFRWRQDGWRQLWDAASHPEHVQYLMQYHPDEGSGDCEDVSLYIGSVISRQFGIPCETLSVMWVLGGHNVCLIRNLNGTFCYMDYGWPSMSRKTVAEVVADVRSRYSPGKASLGWVRSGLDLVPLELHRE